MRAKDARRLRAGAVVWVSTVRLTGDHELRVAVEEAVVIQVVPDKHVVNVEKPGASHVATAPFANVHETKRLAIDDTRYHLCRVLHQAGEALTWLQGLRHEGVALSPGPAGRDADRVPVQGHEAVQPADEA